MFSSLKNRAITTGLKVAINSKISKYGQITTLDLDTKSKSISMDLELLGESEVVSLTVDSYKIDINSTRSEITLYGIHTNKEWLDMLASDFIVGKTFTIPPKYAKHFKILT